MCEQLKAEVSEGNFEIEVSQLHDFVWNIGFATLAKAKFQAIMEKIISQTCASTIAYCREFVLTTPIS